MNRKNMKRNMEKITRLFRRNGILFRHLVLLLAIIVVFTTTYALVLPAIALDVQKAQEEPGVEIEGNEDGSSGGEQAAGEEDDDEEALAEKSETKSSDDSKTVKSSRESKESKNSKKKKKSLFEEAFQAETVLETEHETDKHLKVEEAASVKEPAEETTEQIVDTVAPESIVESAGSLKEDEHLAETSTSNDADQDNADDDDEEIEQIVKTADPELQEDNEEDPEEPDQQTEEGEAFIENASPVKFSHMLTEDTGLWVKNSEGDWESITEDTVLSRSETLIVRLAYEIPQGTLSEKNAKVSYKLPKKLPINKASARMANDPDNHLNQVIEGVRLPGEKLADDEEEYLAGTYKLDKSLTGRYQLKITFNDYSIAENAESDICGWLMFYIKDARLSADKEGKGSITFSENAANGKELKTEYTILSDGEADSDVQDEMTEDFETEPVADAEADTTVDTEAAESEEMLESETETESETEILVEDEESAEETEIESAEETVSDTETETESESELETETDSESETETETETESEAESLAWGVNGKEYEYRLDGGTGISLRDLFTELGVCSDDPDSEEDEVREFLDNIEEASFSNSDLAWVGKVNYDNTIADIKEFYEMDCEYSADLTEDDIEALDSREVYAGEWGFVSYAPFGVEILTISMNNGEEFVINMTASQGSKTMLKASGDTYEITLNYDENAEIPNDARLEVREILPGDDDYAEYYDSAVRAAKGEPEENSISKTISDHVSDLSRELSKEVRKAAGVEEEEKNISDYGDNYARFFDIEIWSGDQKIEPKAEVSVNIQLHDAPADTNANPNVVHFAEEGPEVMDIAEPEDRSENEDAESKAEDITFSTDGFSVYGVVYTVDFHWEVNGKSYTIIMPGGGFMSFSALVEALGTAKKDKQDKSAEEVPVPVVYNLNDIPVSQETKEFVADVESVVFSSPELMWVGKAETDISVGTLKEENKLKAQYSAGLTEEQIAQINAQMVEAGDWALISLKPFTSNETLTVTMKNGDQFVVRVTDAQDPSVFLGKEVIIYDNTEKQAMTSNYATDYRTHFNTIDEIIADSNESARWKIEQTNGGYYLRSNDGKYLYLDHSNVRLVNNAGEATVLTIQAGGNPDYRIYAANNNQNALRYCENNEYPGFFSAVDGTNGAGTSREWLYIREATALVEPLGDWLLYFDDDFSGKEITIRVGETITLRPYNKWEWKEGNIDVQTDHWNVGTWNEWNISSSDGNGSKLTKTTDGPFEFTRYVKYDDQLITHYWSVQGRATQTGTYTLTNTKNNKTITVHVVDEPVDHPKTINKIANIKVNLFDYDKYGTLDGSWNNSTQWWNDDNHANDSGYKNVSVNRMGGSDHFYFLSSGGGDQWNESWNDYTHDDPNTRIVKNELGSDGYPVLNHGNNTSLKYLFDSTKTSWNGGSNSNDPDGMICYPDVIGMFQKDPVTGYYYFNSNTNYYYYDTDTGTSYLYEHTYTQASSQEKNSLVNDKPIGFFPFHEYDSTDNLSVNQNHNLNHHIGMSMEVEFMLPRDRKDDNNQPIIFDFSGDDDLWVFVEWEKENGVKESKLLLDLGGVHQPIHGDINFTTGQNTAFMETNRPYTLKVFYLERGGCDSNCSIKFNLPIIQELNVAKKLTGLTEAENEKYSGEEFWYELVIDRKPYGQPVPYTYPNPENRYEKAVIRNAAGEDVTPEGFTITNGRFKLKDGETLTISYLDRTDKFTVAELKTDNMENFEVPNAERFYHQEHDASLYEEEITLTASNTVDEEYEDWITPEYELEDTEKVTFTNTLKEKNLEVEKKWMGNQEHPESITFTVSATVDDGQGGRTPYAVAELKNTNGTDKVFTLNDDNDWRHEIEHLPVNTPDGKFIFYDIQEGHAEGYALTGIKDLTAENYNYCNIDVVKLWPDSNGNHTEVLQVVLKNSEGKYYAGVDNDGKATFVDDIDDAQIRELKPGNNYSQRYDRLPYGDYSAEQLHEDEYNHGLATYKRAIIQYDLENTPLVNPVDPEEETVTPVIHKRIDALRDGTANPDSAHAGEDLTDLYRLYLDYKIDSLQDPNGVDLLFVIDHSGSMNDSHWPGNEYRAPAVMAALNGENGIIAKFLAANDKNRWAAVGFKGPDGFRDYEFALSNPWQPKKNDDLSNDNAGQNGSEVLSSGGTSYAFTRNAASIELDNEGPLIQSNYTAGFWRAEQFLLKQDVKTDGRKKVVIFIADGVPTLHIGEPEADSLNGSLQNAGTAAGSNYYREEYGGCPDKALAEFGYFVSDLTGNGNGYVFGGDNGNIDFYAIGLGALMQTEDSSDPDDPMSGSELLNGMLSAAYGQTVPANHYMTITDATSNTDGSAANTLGKDLRIILGLNDTFSNLVIQDDLSKYVDLYGLTTGSSASAIMNAAKAKVTMAVPDPEHPEDPPQVITLYENGAPVDDDAAKFTKADGTTKATIINRLEYVADSKTVKAVFDSEYHPAYDVTYTLSFDVKATNDAYTTYAATGYDKYTSGEQQGQTIVGDEDTDFLGTTPANATSVDKPGFRSNDEAKATYVHNDKDEEEKYPHPVIQVVAYADIVKIDQTGAALEGAKFNLYDHRYDAGKTIEENAEYLIEADLQSKKPTDPPGDDAVIRSGKLSVGTYYLVETETPGGYNPLPGPVKITVTESEGILSMAAEIAGVSIGSDKLQRISNGVWKLKIQNTAGLELPYTGGPGTWAYTILGSILILGAGVLLWRRRRLI